MGIGACPAARLGNLGGFTSCCARQHASTRWFCTNCDLLVGPEGYLAIGADRETTLLTTQVLTEAANASPRDKTASARTIAVVFVDTRRCCPAPEIARLGKTYRGGPPPCLT